jgi:AhpC/TSA family
MARLNAVARMTATSGLRYNHVRTIRGRTNPGWTNRGFTREDRRGEIGMQVNDKAPTFNTTDENGKEVALKDFLGKTLVLFFYPKADTPG